MQLVAASEHTVALPGDGMFFAWGDHVLSQTHVPTGLADAENVPNSIPRNTRTQRHHGDVETCARMMLVGILRTDQG